MTSSAPPADTRLTLPTWLTLARLVAAPAVAGAILWASLAPEHQRPAYGLALGLFLIAALTDWLDGWLARKLNQTSILGAALDHSADKAVVTASLVMLAGTGLSLDLVIAAALILTRDVAVAGLREGMALAGRSLPVMKIGKVKTVFEMAAVAGLIAARIEPLEAAEPVARYALFAAAALALWSGGVYFVSAFRPR